MYAMPMGINRYYIITNINTYKNKNKIIMPAL